MLNKAVYQRQNIFVLKSELHEKCFFRDIFRLLVSVLVVYDLPNANFKKIKDEKCVLPFL